MTGQIHVAVLMGGWAHERPVSLSSGNACADALEARGFKVTRVDVDRSIAARLAELKPDARSAVVTLTHDPKLDDPALDAALRSPAFYIGALGSRRTHAKRVARLKELGHGDGAIARIHAPVGLDIAAVTAAEIALSVMAEIVAARRGAALGAPRPQAAPDPARISIGISA